MSTCSSSIGDTFSMVDSSTSWIEENEQSGLQQTASHFWWVGRVWSLSQDRRGCWDLQLAFEAMQSESERISFVNEFCGHIMSAVRCPHANYVLQKCIALTRPHHIQFMIDEISSKGVKAIANIARHKYGCRIIQRLLEYCKVAQVKGLVDALISDAVVSCEHPFANYAMQHILEYGADDQRRCLTQLLVQSASRVASNVHAMAVVRKAMKYASHEEQYRLAKVFRWHR